MMYLGLSQGEDALIRYVIMLACVVVYGKTLLPCFIPFLVGQSIFFPP